MVREITLNDKQIFLEMAQEFYASDAVLHSIPPECHVCTFNEAINSKIYLRILIIEYNQTICGYCVISKKFSTEAGGFCMWIEDIYVKPEFRSKGLGKEVFEYIDANFKYAKRLRLEVEKNNSRAIQLYKKMGFEVLDYLQMVAPRKVDIYDKI